MFIAKVPDWIIFEFLSSLGVTTIKADVEIVIIYNTSDLTYKRVYNMSLVRK